nr:sigma-70 family RNA polymerase sigma factor [Lachnospiraceae bacterium]
MKHTDMNDMYREHAKIVYSFLLKMCQDPHLAEDLMQDTFLKAMEHIDAFDGKCKLTTWLCQIAKNTYYDHLRKQKKFADTEVVLDELTGGGPTPEQEVLSKETAKEIRMYIHQLPEPYKEVFLLRFYAELSFREIGQMFGKSEVWGRVTYLRSKDMLIERMENKGKEV